MFLVYVSCHNKNENSEFGMTIHISLNYIVRILPVIFVFFRLFLFYFVFVLALCFSSPQDYKLAGHIEKLPNPYEFIYSAGLNSEHSCYNTTVLLT